jgi:hypothetical protein
MVHQETVETLRATREWVEKATDHLRPFGSLVTKEGDAMLARIDAALAAEAGASAAGGWNQQDQQHPSPCGPKVYL